MLNITTFGSSDFVEGTLLLSPFPWDVCVLTVPAEALDQHVFFYILIHEGQADPSYSSSSECTLAYARSKNAQKHNIKSFHVM